MSGDEELTSDPGLEQRVTSALSALEPIEPPAAFVAQVMQRAERVGLVGQSPTPAARVDSGLRRRIPARTLLVGLTSAAAVALVALLISGRTPAIVSGTQAAIGAAMRHDADPAAASGDAAAQSALDAFTRTPAYQELRADPLALTLLGRADVQRALTLPGVPAALSRRVVREAILAGQIREALTDPTTGATSITPEVVPLLSSIEVKDVVARPAVQSALDTPAFVDGLGTPGFLRLLTARIAR